MCLLLDSSASPKPLVASEDIVCYKVLFKTAEFYEQYQLKLNPDWMDTVKDMRDNGIEYMSPYRSAPYEVGRLYKSKLGKPWQYGPYHRFRVDHGLHTFVKQEEAATMGELVRYPSMMVIVKCRIPKGAKYYVGEFKGRVSYASDALIVDEVVE